MITRTHLSRIEQRTWSFYGTSFLTACLKFSVDLFLRLRITARFNLSFPSFRYQLENPAFKFFPTWGTSGIMDNKRSSGSMEASSLFPSSQSAVSMRKTQRTHCSPRSRQLLQARKHGKWLDMTLSVALSSHIDVFDRQAPKWLSHVFV